MALLLTSRCALLRDGEPYQPAIDALQRLSAGDDGAVGVLSRNSRPAWWDRATAGTDIAFVQVQSRGNGEAIRTVAERLSMDPHQVLVLAADRMDVAMAKNGHATLLKPGWIDDAAAESTRGAGIPVETPEELEEVAGCLDRWSGGWFWGTSQPRMEVRVLFDPSRKTSTSFKETFFKEKFTRIVKERGPQSNAMAALLCRSILHDFPPLPKTKTAFALIPGSSSGNDDTDALSETLHAVRTATSRVRLAYRGKPILERTVAGTPRHKQPGNDRTDPTGQLNSMRVNPHYRDKLVGRTIYLLDDFTTHGVSFCVGRALLLAAGALQVNAVAFGKFGGCFRFQDIRLREESDCFLKGEKPFDAKPPIVCEPLPKSRPHAEFEKAFPSES